MSESTVRIIISNFCDFFIFLFFKMLSVGTQPEITLILEQYQSNISISVFITSFYYDVPTKTMLTL